ncbi:MAG TPA: Asp-tRNA(Asn)/Glu-tRNA(Gln) amidotransferase subunit GatC [Candidatus Kapabacteria bacterium]|nr:Asp-tRNA(Asn)/Glu-tRNA(Gln) amidotransferase subunit GatC [Candidatus Kapabacteria bacterium]
MISRKDTEHIAKLARLEFTDAEYEQLTGELNDVIAHIDQLNELDVKNVEPLENINELVETNVVRADVAKECLPVEEALKNAPKAADGFFLVPKVIEQVRKEATISSEDEEDYYE